MSLDPPALPSSESLITALTFSWTAPDGSVWSTTPSLESAPQAPAQRFKIDITRDGVAAGISRRSVRRSPGHGNHVEHVTLYLKEGSKGRGFGTAYWDACLARYADLALHRVVITADEDGRLFWARDPVRFERPEIPRHILRNLEASSGLDGPDWPGFRAVAAKRGLAEDEATTFAELVDETPEAFTPKGLYESDLGRLLLSTVGWKGVVELRPWTPPPTRSRFRSA